MAGLCSDHPVLKIAADRSHDLSLVLRFPSPSNKNDQLGSFAKKYDLTQSTMSEIP